MLWQARIGPLASAGKTREARDAAAKYARYTHRRRTLGFHSASMDYNLAEKAAALADFQKALALDPTVRRQFEPPAAGAAPAGGRGGQRLRAIFGRQGVPEAVVPGEVVA